MRILIIDSASQSSATAKMLDGRGHDVMTSDATGAWSKLREQAWDVVVSEWPSMHPCVEDFVAQVRGTQSSYVAVVLVTSKTSAAQAEEAFRGGVDDFARKPVGRGEFLARLERAHRLVSLERGAPGASKAPNLKPVSKFERLRAWGEFGHLSASTLSEMTALKFDVLGDLQSFSPSCAVEVPLAAAIDQTELRFIIEVENVSLGNVGMAMFGPPPLETAGLLDLLLEIGNTAAGTFVRRALEDDSELTMGLPAALSVEDVSRRVETMTAVRDVGICTTDGGTRLRVRVGIRGKKNVLVPVSKLREGMVLASDVKSTSGVLLARAGTRMTSNQAERITAMLGNTTVVEVSDAAA